MTKQEASEKYRIPVEILDEYESWGLCSAVKEVIGSPQYDDNDLEYLSMIMALHDIGFTSDEVETFMRLLLEGDYTAKDRMRMLNKRRSCTLDEIHLREKQLDRMDYLRHKISQANQKLGGI